MKYLQSKSVFEHLKIYEDFNFDHINDDIKDIFIDLIDNGFDIKIVKSDFGGYIIEITKKGLPGSPNSNFPHGKPGDGSGVFNINYDITESILRVIDYLKINNLYLNNLKIGRLKIKNDYVIPRYVSEVFGVVNVTEEGLFIRLSFPYSNFNKAFNKSESELVTFPVYKIIIKYSDKEL